MIFLTITNNEWIVKRAEQLGIAETSQRTLPCVRAQLGQTRLWGRECSEVLRYYAETARAEFTNGLVTVPDFPC